MGQSIAQTKPAAEPKKTDISDELREKSNGLLNALAREADQFYVPENRIKARVLVANLLWDADEKQARQLFQNAIGELDTLIGQYAVLEIDEDEEYMTVYNLGELRTELLMEIAAHDPSMALTALQTLSRKKPDGTDFFEGDEALELQLAAEIVNNDPQRAYDMAIQSLENEVGYGVFEALEAIHKKDDELGAKLAREILSKIKSKENTGVGGSARVSPAANRTDNRPVATPADGDEINIWQIKMFYDMVKTLNRRAVRDKKKPALSESDYKDLLHILAQKYVKQQYLGPYEVSSIISELDRYFPASAQAIRRKMTDNAGLLEEMRLGDDFQAEIEDKTTEEIIQIIEKKPAAQRDTLYNKATERAYEDGRILAAKELYSKVKTRPEYDYMEQELANKLPLALAESGDLNEVREMLSQIKSPEERIEVLTALAKSILAKGDAKTARGLTDEARAMYSGRMKSRKNLASILQLSQVLAVLEPEQGFSFLENNMSFINEVIAAGILIDEFNDAGSLKGDELLLISVQGESYRNAPQGVGLIKDLARSDFDRTVAIADRFARREVRFYARFRIAQALLDPQAEEIEKENRQMYENMEYEGH